MDTLYLLHRVPLNPFYLIFFPETLISSFSKSSSYHTFLYLLRYGIFQVYEKSFLIKTDFFFNICTICITCSSVILLIIQFPFRIFLKNSNNLVLKILNQFKVNTSYFKLFYDLNSNYYFTI